MKYPQEITTTGSAAVTSSETVSADIGTHEERWSEESINRAIDVWELSRDEAKQLRRLKDTLSDVNHRLNTPHELVKYIKGPKGMEKAEEMFRFVINWRLEYGTDTLLDNYKPPRILYDYIATAMLEGVDYVGDPVYLERAGAIDGLGLVKRYDKNALLKHTVWLRELTATGAWRRDYEKKYGHQPRQVTVIFDLKGLSTRHAKTEVIQVFKELVSYTAERYYGVSKRMIIIRAPTIFRMVWQIAKHFYSPELQKKMIFAPKDYLSVIDQYMDRDILPPSVNPEGHGRAARGFPPNLDGGLIPADLDKDEEVDVAAAADNNDVDSQSKGSSTTQSVYTRSGADSFASSNGEAVMIPDASNPSVASKSLFKGSVDANSNTTVDGQRQKNHLI